MDEQVAAYVGALAPMQRSLFDRLHAIVVTGCPDVAVTFSYKMPTYVLGSRRFHVALWKHGLSLYGISEDRDGGFLARHPELKTSKGTIQIRPQDAESI